MFHVIAEEGLGNVLDRIWNATRQKELEHILKLKNNDGELCLHSAVKNLRGIEAEKIMIQLFDMGADLDAQDDTGDTVLHIAVKQQDYQLVKWLLSLRIDINIKYKSELTAYQLAEEKKDYKMTTMILSKKGSFDEWLVKNFKSIAFL
ncbi:putative ankyrin repeat protein RF_0381 [Cydia pomonella]|uniref:putative ankyrin repeat protein RF_0381 n=1 Tax=Cydia pomonella TaxID=82600 RepID=UPI002ADD6CED|nr:putative ankyrin repeat protein RF_0381 [Cydia pomonella]